MSVAKSGSKKVAGAPFQNLAKELNLRADLEQLKFLINRWIERSNPEVADLLQWQLISQPKYFRPFTIFSCHRAVKSGPVPKQVMLAAVALELFHNVSLIVDDILDRSRFRRNRLTLHCRYGSLPALMTSGYITAGGFELVSQDPYSLRLLSELMQRLGVAECFQWRLRRQPLSVADWREIAAEDTGSMFEICAGLGTRDDRLRKFGCLLGMLYHGCDDVADARGLSALGGGGDADVRDGILTLPAAIAIQDPRVAVLFRAPSAKSGAFLTRKIAAAIPEAEEVLNEIADAATKEAIGNASNPKPLLELIRHTRTLSRT
jgi:geranylgeranyl pyrophosphate synthase